jgi:DNA-binding transcriptional MerR regulator
MDERRERTFGIRELVQASGVPRRTIRYYVQRGLLPPPEGRGRGHFYRESHLETLLRIKELQGRGQRLSEIGARLEGGGEEPPAPRVELASRIVVADGVELLLAHGTAPPHPAQVRALAEAAARILHRGDVT